MLKKILIPTYLLALSLINQFTYAAESCSGSFALPFISSLKLSLPQLGRASQKQDQTSKRVKRENPSVDQESSSTRNSKRLLLKRIGKHTQSALQIVKSIKKGRRTTMRASSTNRKSTNFIFGLANSENTSTAYINLCRQDCKDMPRELQAEVLSILEQLNQALDTMKLILNESINARRAHQSFDSSNSFENITNNFRNALESLEYIDREYKIKNNSNSEYVHELASYLADTLRKISDNALFLGNKNAASKLTSLEERLLLL